MGLIFLLPSMGFSSVSEGQMPKAPFVLWRKSLTAIYFRIYHRCHVCTYSSGCRLNTKLISGSLFGVTVAQGFVYFYENRDRWPLRTFASFLYFYSLLTLTGSCSLSPPGNRASVWTSSSIPILAPSQCWLMPSECLTWWRQVVVHRFFDII